MANIRLIIKRCIKTDRRINLLMIKVLVTGVNGQLGHDVCKVLNERHIENLGVDMNDFDITDAGGTATFIRAYAPTAVIHCAAYTAVDKAEDHAELCTKVNVDGTRNIAIICKELNAKMIYISTDYVFPGTGILPYGTDDATAPLGVYGKTKLDGELLVKELLTDYFIVRTSWVFGMNGNNFIKTMLRLGKEHAEVSVVCDQIGSPTYTADLAPLLCDMAMTEKYGTYHATNEGYCSWAEFAEEIFKISNMGKAVRAIPTREYPTRAKRPLNSRLCKDSLSHAGFAKLPSWQNALEQYLSELL